MITYQVDRRDLTICMTNHCDLTVYLSTSYHVFEIYISTLIAAFVLGPLSFLQFHNTRHFPFFGRSAGLTC
jgi:uncharacterized membrane protein YjjB (DUF3815 family)